MNPEDLLVRLFPLLFSLDSPDDSPLELFSCLYSPRGDTPTPIIEGEEWDGKFETRLPDTTTGFPVEVGVVRPDEVDLTAGLCIWRAFDFGGQGFSFLKILLINRILTRFSDVVDTLRRDIIHCISLRPQIKRLSPSSRFLGPPCSFGSASYLHPPIAVSRGLHPHLARSLHDSVRFSESVTRISVRCWCFLPRISLITISPQVLHSPPGSHSSNLSIFLSSHISHPSHLSHLIMPNSNHFATLPESRTQNFIFFSCDLLSA